MSLRVAIEAAGLAADVVATATAAEAEGIDRVSAAEITTDPFVSLACAASATSRVELSTGVAIAFARTPMTLAYAAWTLQEASGGRAVIGLGSQIRPHIEQRFGMPWGRPAARMREFILATRAIWTSWQDGAPLDIRGQHYSHTLMTPMFAPPPIPAGPPPILLAGVGPLMTRVAAEVADGLVIHPFSSADHLDAQVLPAVRDARAHAEEDQSPWAWRPFEIAAGQLIATGHDADELVTSLTALRERIAFYASTPAYAAVLEHHGWGDLQPTLQAMSRAGQWTQMGERITDEMVVVFGIVGTPEEVAAGVRDRWASRADSVTLVDPAGAASSAVREVAARVAATSKVPS